MPHDSTTVSETAMRVLAKSLKDPDIDIKKNLFTCLHGTNSMSRKTNVVQ